MTKSQALAAVVEAARESAERSERIMEIIDTEADIRDPQIWRPTIRAHAKINAVDLRFTLAELDAAPDEDALPNSCHLLEHTTAADPRGLVLYFDTEEQAIRFANTLAARSAK